VKTPKPINLSIPELNLSCEAREGETVLSVLIRQGVTVSAPCGGRGLCGKCGVTLVEGAVGGIVPDSGGRFPACRALIREDIAISIDAAGELVNETTAGRKPPGTAKKVPRLGAAVDIGTTTISAECIDLDTGESLGLVSRINDQQVFGADVMNRINAAQNGKTGELFALVNKQTGRLLRFFAEQYGLSDRVEKCAVTGNTTMLHLFANINPSGMGAVPFTPVFLEQREYRGEELSLPAAELTLLPGISAFVGSDITSGLAFLDILEKKDKSLFIDIGTNGEMALWSGGKLRCCSTAAGPAFEGAEISCGIGGIPGAVNRVALENGKIVCDTIGGIPPRGICGAGLVDALALMLETEVIDETGAMAEEYGGVFPLTDGVSLGGRDVRQYQLAKSAIASGIELLCKSAGENPDGLDTIYIAGGFGFFINLENAVKTKLLPESFLGKTAVCGNLSLKGAVKSLVSTDFASRCRGIIAQCEILELASERGFTEAFAENMYF
jgi:uncharacterized 2Fe-2S/4Fe-4S cluster protein (DUF4445 family)